MSSPLSSPIATHVTCCRHLRRKGWLVYASGLAVGFLYQPDQPDTTSITNRVIAASKTSRRGSTHAAKTSDDHCLWCRTWSVIPCLSHLLQRPKLSLFPSFRLGVALDLLVFSGYPLREPPRHRRLRPVRGYPTPPPYRGANYSRRRRILAVLSFPLLVTVEPTSPLHFHTFVRYGGSPGAVLFCGGNGKKMRNTLLYSTGKASGRPT